MRRAIYLCLAAEVASAPLLGTTNVDVYRIAYAAGEVALTKSPPRQNGVSGLQSSVSVTASFFGRGEPIQFRYRVINQSSQPVTFWNAAFWGTHRLRLAGPDGAMPPLTVQGAQALDAFRSGEIRKNVPVTLSPGEAWTAGPFDLTDYYGIDAPGEYRLQVQYQYVGVSVLSEAAKFVLQ